MKIKQLYLYGFGKHQDRLFTFTDQTVVLGNNETGKSTVYEAILQILFGFPTRASSRRLEPKSGGSYGGWIKVSIQDSTYQIERTIGKSSGTVTVTRNGSLQGGEEFLTQLLNGLTRGQVESIFAFHLFDLQQLHQLSQEDLTELFFVSGTTGENPYAQLKKEAGKNLQTLYRPGGRKPQINEQLEKMKKLEQELAKSTQQEVLYHQLVEQQRTIEGILEEKRQQTSNLKAQIFDAEQQEMLQPLFEEQQILNQHPDLSTAEISEGDQLAVKKWYNECEELKWRCSQISWGTVDGDQMTATQGRIELLEAFLDHESVWRENQAKAAELEEQLEAIVRKQQPLLAALQLSPTDVEVKIESYDLSFEKETQLHRLLSEIKPKHQLKGKLFTYMIGGSIVLILLGQLLNNIWISIVSALLLLMVFLLPNQKETGSNMNKLTAFYKDYGIVPSDDYRAQHIFDYLRELQQTQLTYRQIEEKLHHMNYDNNEILTKSRPLHLVDVEGSNLFRAARAELTKSYDTIHTLQLKQAEYDNKKQQWGELNERINQCNEEIQNMFQRFGVSNMMEFEEEINKRNAAKKMRERLKELDFRLKGHVPQELSKKTLQLALDEHEQQIESFIHEALTVQQKLEHLIGDEKKSELLQNFMEEQALLDEMLIDYLAWQAIQDKIEQLYAHYQQDIFPSTLKRASELFVRFTNGAYQTMTYQDQQFTVLDQTGFVFEVKELSQATKEQAYLALRFALAEEMAKEKPFMIIMDDPFVHFDATRFQQVVQWLMSDDNTLPYIYFSCHEEMLAYQEQHTILHMEPERSLL